MITDAVTVSALMSTTAFAHLLTGDKEISMLFQSLTVLADHMIQAEVQLIKGERLLRVSGSFSCRVIVSFLKRANINKADI